MEYDIRRADRPCFHEIETGERGKSIVISVDPQAAKFIQEALSKPDIPIVEDLEQRLGLAKFIPPTKDDWGFGPVLQKISGGNESWVSWQCAFPEDKKLPEKKRSFPFAVSGSLTVLYLVLDLFREASAEDKKQLLYINMAAGREMASNHLDAWLGKSLMPYLASFPDHHLHKGVEETMRVTYEIMTGDKDIFPSYFAARFRQPNWLNLSCPGNGCGLDPEYYRTDGRGYTLLPHNVDTPYQQLSLLAGLAFIHREARQKGF